MSVRPRTGRALGILAVTIALPVFLLALELSPPPFRPEVSSAVTETWSARADSLISRALAAEPPDAIHSEPMGSFEQAALAQAIATRPGRGWTDPDVVRLLGQVLASQHPDGGFGTPTPFAAFGDPHPVSTSFTVTMTAQVGRVLVAAYRRGAIPATPLYRILDKLATMGRVPVSIGQCFPYSDQFVDLVAGRCVHNVNAGVGLFLQEYLDSGLSYRYRDVVYWQMTIAMQEASTYLRPTGNWLYRDGSSVVNDAGHRALSTEAALRLIPPIGSHALYVAMALDSGVWPHLQLARYACSEATAWDAQIGSYLSGALPYSLLVQAAQDASLNSESCK
jgi:hypothetical protein